MDKLTFVLIATLLMVMDLRAQVTIDGYDFTDLQYVSNICYDLEYIEKIRIAKDPSFNTLTIFDKLKFKGKVYQNDHHEYLNEDGNYTHDVAYVSHENMFPKWYTPPTLVRTDKSGVKSFFSRTNQYLNDGWTGGHFSTTEHGEYVSDPRRGGAFFNQPFSVNSERYYTEKNTMVQTYGLLYKYAYKIPSTSMLNHLQSMGYQVSNTSTEITVQNQSAVFIWDTVRKTIIRQFLEGGIIVRTAYIYYVYNEAFDNYLISRKVTVTPQKFDNGDCYDQLEQLVYTNFSMTCNALQPLQGNEGTELSDFETNAAASTNLLFYPNPVSDQLTVQIPDHNSASILTISSLSGSKLLVRKIGIGESQYSLGIADLPSGLYTIQLVQGEQNYSAKLVKQ